MITSFKRFRHLSWLLPVVVVIALYAQVRGHIYIDFDDGYYTYDNPIIQKGLTWEGFKWAFTETYAANYHPLTWLSHMLDFELFKNRPGMFALENAAFHAANSVLVGILLVTLFQNRTAAIAAATVFAAHPKLVEAVAWISQRKTLLSTFFALLAMISYLYSVRRSEPRDRRRYYAFSIVSYAVSLLAKGMYVTMPAILLLMELIPAENTRSHPGTFLRSVATRIAPFACLAALFSVVTYWAQAEGAAVQSFEELPLGMRLQTALVGMMTYLRHFFYPIGLSVYYQPPQEWPVSAYVGSGLVLTAVSAALFAFRRKAGNAAPIGWLLFLGMLLPVIGIIQVGGQASADRYMYGPIIGLLIACVSIALAMANALSTKAARRIAGAGLVIWMAFAATVAHRQIRNWQNTFSLSSASEAVVGQLEPLINMQVTFFLRFGRAEDAINLCRPGVELYPGSVPLNQNLALAHFRNEEFSEAIMIGKRAVELAPKNPLGVANLAMFYEANGEIENAWNAVRRARELKPRDANTLSLLNRLEDGMEKRYAEKAGTEFNTEDAPPRPNTETPVDGDPAGARASSDPR